MSIKQLSEFYYPKKCLRLEKLIREYNDSEDTDEKILYHLEIIKKYSFSKNLGKNIKICEMGINFQDICPYLKCTKSRRLDEEYSSTMVTYMEKNILYEKFLYEYLQQNYGKHIFIDIYIENYGIDDELIEKKKEAEYIHHRTCAFLQFHKNKYYCYYISPYGNELPDLNYFHDVFSRKRWQEIKYSKSIDCLFFKSLLVECQKETKIKFIYNYSKKFTYRGVNLQAGDNHGVCFIFPVLFFYYLGRFYNRKFIKHRNFKTTKHLLLNGRLNQVVELSIVGCSKEYNEIFISQMKKDIFSYKQLTENLQKILEEEKFRYIKNILQTILSYFNQDFFKNKYNHIYKWNEN
mgnify:CR=1 FL=1